MLAKRARLGAEQVKKVLKEGRSKRGSTLSVKIISGPVPFRTAVVVSKKLAKTAVVRNKVRRAVYEALRKSTLPSSGHAILFVQALPKEEMAHVFASEIKKLLHV